MERLIRLLKESSIDNYKIVRTDTESSELFFVRKRTDLRRVRENAIIELTVYIDGEKDGKKVRGESTVQGDPYMTDEEWLEKIKSASFSAGRIKNKYYETAPKTVSEEVTVQSDMSNKKTADIATAMAEALLEADTDTESFINSAEVFAERTRVIIVSSKGTKVSYVKTNVNGEFVVQCKAPKDVETYQAFDFDSLDLQGIKELVKETAKLTKDRARATQMPPSGKADIILSGKYMPDIMKFYVERALADKIYPEYSDFEIGKNVQGEDVKGELITARLVPTKPFSHDGIKLEEREFIDKGVLKVIHGSTRYMDYLNKEPVGGYSKLSLNPGSVEYSKLFERPCIHIVNFSDFDMDSDEGCFKGEIRLGYLYDGKGNVSLVTGGSINGSILEAQKDFLYTKETINRTDYEGPKAILLRNVSVAGK